MHATQQSEQTAKKGSTNLSTNVILYQEIENKASVKTALRGNILLRYANPLNKACILSSKLVMLLLICHIYKDFEISKEARKHKMLYKKKGRN